MKVDRIHLVLGLLWLIAGMALGEHMGRTQDHGQMPTHAHIMLVGGVLPVLWAILNRVWKMGSGLLAWAQLVLHHAGAAIMIVGLYKLYGGGNGETLGPVLGVSALLVMLATVLMLFLAIRARPDSA
ncbi:TonB-dependent receptor [Hyphobacterium sp.]|uniref:TonB-dependent receptor n=1 Tax=Hyphobacterium sp. TaxID=2004662 RepID=UPI00374A710D